MITIDLSIFVYPFLVIVYKTYRFWFNRFWLSLLWIYRFLFIVIVDFSVFVYPFLVISYWTYWILFMGFWVIIDKVEIDRKVVTCRETWRKRQGWRKKRQFCPVASWHQEWRDSPFSFLTWKITSGSVFGSLLSSSSRAGLPTTK